MPEQTLRELATAIRVADGRVILDNLRTTLGVSLTRHHKGKPL